MYGLKPVPFKLTHYPIVNERMERKAIWMRGGWDERACGGDLRVGSGVQRAAFRAAGCGPLAEEERCGDFAADLWRLQRAAGGGDCAWGLSAGPVADSGHGGKLDDVRVGYGADDYLSNQAGKSRELRF